MCRRQRCWTLLVAGMMLFGGQPASADVFADARRGYATNGEVRIHYATLGQGPLVVLIHGFPDFWYSWRHQMSGLKDHFQLVAIDQRGYNKSGAPAAVEAYAMPNLIEDVAAVIRHFGKSRAVIVGHDWGGAVAWNFAFARPEMVDKLVILNLPHPNGIARVAATNAEARANTNYARVFQKGSATDPDVFFGGPMTAETLSGWVRDPAARARYLEAFNRSSFDGMLAYYKMNYPSAPSEGSAPAPAAPQLNKQVLIFHGLEDTALHSDALNNTWDWIDQDVTIVSVPGAGHFVQQDAAGLVTSTMKWWLLARSTAAQEAALR